MCVCVCLCCSCFKGLKGFRLKGFRGIGFRSGFRVSGSGDVNFSLCFWRLPPRSWIVGSLGMTVLAALSYRGLNSGLVDKLQVFR